VNFDAILSGTFSSAIASSSSVNVCITGVCANPATSPGAFNLSLPFSLSPSNGAFSFDYAFISQFGAASPAASFVLFSFPAPTPNILYGGIVNAASFAAVGLTPVPVAPGSLVAIFTSALAATQSAFTTASLPGALGGASVTFNSVTAPMVSVTPGGQYPYITAQVPFEVLQSGQTSAAVPVVLTVNGIASPPMQAQIVSSAPGIFTIPPTGLGNAILVYLNPAANAAALAGPATASLGYPTAPIPRGTNGFFYVTGLGAMTPPVADGSGTCPASNGLCNANAMPQVLIGGELAPVAFAGQAAGYPGVFQVNIMVPQNAPTGNSISLIVKSADGTVTSNTATIAVQ
jgi:uncharacterized protein (TIGR03437 family)